MELAQVNAKDAMTLRQRTGLGIMDCKKALADAMNQARQRLFLSIHKRSRPAA